MLLGNLNQFFSLEVVTCALRSAQHWAHFSIAIALASSNVHHSNLAPWWQRGLPILPCEKCQQIGIIDIDTNGARYLANFRLNFVRCVFELWVACQSKDVKLEATEPLVPLRSAWI